MRRGVTIAAFVLLVALVPTYAQRGGMRGFGGGHGGFGGGGVARPPAGSAFGGMHGGFRGHTFFGGGFRGNGFRRNGFNGFFFRGGFRHHCFGCRNFFGFPWFGGFVSWPWWGDTYSSGYSFDQEQARETALANEMNQLSIEEQRLREREDEWERRRDEEQSARRPQPQQEARAQAAQPTVLVFRDQHQQEVQNYAIVDGTLWVFTEQTAKKIALADLDLPATTKINDERGVEFVVPK